MMEMHTAKLPDGGWVYIIGKSGDWSIYTSHIDFSEAEAWMIECCENPKFEGIQSLASAELILEQTFGAKA